MKGIKRLALILGIAVLLGVLALSGSGGVQPVSATVFPIGPLTTINAASCIAPWGTWGGVHCTVTPGFLVQFLGGFTLPAGDTLSAGREAGIETDASSTIGAGATLSVTQGATFSIDTAATVVSNAGFVNIGSYSFLSIAPGATMNVGAVPATLKVFSDGAAYVAGTLVNGGAMAIASYGQLSVLGGGIFTNNGNLQIVTQATLQIQPSGTYSDYGTVSLSTSSISDMGTYNEFGATTLTSSSYISVNDGGTLALNGGSTLTLKMHGELYIDNLGSTASAAAGSTIATVGAHWLINNEQGSCIGAVGAIVPVPSPQWGFTPVADQC